MIDQNYGLIMNITIDEINTNYIKKNVLIESIIWIIFGLYDHFLGSLGDRNADWGNFVGWAWGIIK